MASITCRNYIATDAKFTTLATHHCTPLHAGRSASIPLLNNFFDLSSRRFYVFREADPAFVKLLVILEEGVAALRDEKDGYDDEGASPQLNLDGDLGGAAARYRGLSSLFDRATEIATISHGERKSAMMIELPEKLEAALKVQANAHGVSPAGYVCEVLERDLASSLEGQSSGVPFKTGRGMFAKYGEAPSAEEIDANRADMFQNFGEEFS